MEKIITINDTQQIKLSNNLAWTMEYRQQFGRDALQDHIPLLVSITETISALIGQFDGEITQKEFIQAIEGRVFELLVPIMQTELMSVIIDVTWAMAKAADENILPPMQWVRQFDEFPLDVIVPTVYEMMLSGFVSSKNLKRLTNLKEQMTQP